ncbi:hypothetical protein CGGC5_v000160 [Colletotrichum fructicola Nara gc5]|uniref:Uncharacterized protein n=1 Tax=Colletotrichum fructicola (strain Nara gc5) TaxID=1213859 RepID=A0A7J6JKW4_COLFN|nr:hypothetical protein CGGC5_v000160 [Colletotrichum fructicola Nara gc5]
MVWAGWQGQWRRASLAWGISLETLVSTTTVSGSEVSARLQIQGELRKWYLEASLYVQSTSTPPEPASRHVDFMRQAN